MRNLQFQDGTAFWSMFVSTHLHLSCNPPSSCVLVVYKIPPWVMDLTTISSAANINLPSYKRVHRKAHVEASPFSFATNKRGLTDHQAFLAQCVQEPIRRCWCGRTPLQDRPSGFIRSHVCRNHPSWLWQHCTCQLFSSHIWSTGIINLR